MLYLTHVRFVSYIKVYITRWLEKKNENRIDYKI